MNFTYQDFKNLLLTDESTAFPWECIPVEEQETRKLAKPATNLGSGTVRFWLLLDHVFKNVNPGESLCDFGAYPGTFLRIAREHFHDTVQLSGAGFAFSDEFIEAMQKRNISLLEMEFDIRYPKYSNLKHVLHNPIKQFDHIVCTEVIEHQMYPLSLLCGINRHLRIGGSFHLTTNSASFIGDILKLAVGKHNVESLERSHVLKDDLWRPHIRVYTLEEMSILMKLAGFKVETSFYFENGNCYRGLKRVGINIIKTIVNPIPHMRSHMFVAAKKISEPTPEAIKIIAQSINNYNLQDTISY